MTTHSSNHQHIDSHNVLAHHYFLELSSLDLSAIQREQGWQSRYTEILRLAKGIPSKPVLQQASFEIKGCESRLWMALTLQDNHCLFTLDSESRVIKGLAALLLCELQTRSLNEIAALNPEDILAQYQLQQHISPSRNNGLAILIKAIKQAVKTLRD